MTLLSRLPTIRASVNAEVLSPAAAFAAYSNIMSAIFAVYSASEQVNNDLSVDKQTDASLDAAQALEFASREATLVGGAAAAHGQMTTGDRHLFANAVTSQRLLIASALGEFDAQLRAPWQRAYTSPAHHRFASLENRISGSIGSRAAIPVNVRTWQAASRAFLAELQQAQLQDAPPLAAMASRLSDRLVLEAALAGGVGLVAVLLSIFVLLRYGRRLNGELTTLHDTAQGMADRRLPGVVERLRKGEHVDVDAESRHRRPGLSPRSPGSRRPSPPCSAPRWRPRSGRPACGGESTGSSSTSPCATSRCCTASWACSTRWSGPPASRPPWEICSASTT